MCWRAEYIEDVSALTQDECCADALHVAAATAIAGKWTCLASWNFRALGESASGSGTFNEVNRVDGALARSTSARPKELGP